MKRNEKGIEGRATVLLLANKIRTTRQLSTTLPPTQAAQPTPTLAWGHPIPFPSNRPTACGTLAPTGTTGRGDGDSPSTLNPVEGGRFHSCCPRCQAHAMPCPWVDDCVDGEIILKAIQEGRCYTVVEGYGPSTNFSFKYVSTDTTVSMGGRTRFDTAGALHVSVRLAGDVTIGLFKNGRPETKVNAQEAQFPVEGPGVFRVEISQARCYLPSFDEKPRPWIFSNPIPDILLLPITLAD